MGELLKLYTEDGKNLSGQPWNGYPRPQLKRDSFICLNGDWDFTVNNGDNIPVEFDKKILVPFAPEALLSGIDEIYQENEVLWYKREFKLPEGFKKDRVILHIGACDQYATVFVNNKEVGKHTGGYQPFAFDITDMLCEENTVIVRVEDHLSNCKLPYGKQRRDRGGMWYTPVSGIWQTVWLESVPEEYIKSIRIKTGKDYAEIVADGINCAQITVKTPEGERKVEMKDGKAIIAFAEPMLWSPENPYLYYFTIETETDKVESYFAIRTLEIKEIRGYKRLCLNGEPYFFHGLLDQGYWSDGLFTPATQDGYEKDIRTMKSLGFNVLRKHIKIEPEQFYYDCDRLGMIVFQDMVNNGDYKYFRDTAFPAVSVKHACDSLLHRDKETREFFIKSMEETVERLYNHPCICYWTIFNEGWGQFCSTKMYEHLKKLDNSRFIDSASGWFFGGKTDIDSWHIYFQKTKLKAKNKPLALTECGGYSWKPEGHVVNTENTYGYGSYFDREGYVKAVQSLYTDKILPLIKSGLCCAIYTQVSDIEDETNGILTYDRVVQKILPEELADISQQLKEAIK